ncbi:MAG TPA: D-alanine--D-alanine ligase family protein [Polyangiaceae bacterium]|nr:D-alanine--D-alanine ligase family protein [Polyangiaceae bacterium]
MSQRRLRVGVIFGGRSGEHEVSVMSARGILKALDPDRFEAVPIGIDRDGRWQLVEPRALLAPGQAAADRVGEGALVQAHEVASSAIERRELSDLSGRFGVDVFFPIVHGSQGEDGALQGLLEMAGAPYVGCGVLGSAVGMDKDVSKRLLRDAGLPIVDFVVARAGGVAGAELAQRVERELGYPCFVKPANLGSSVGVSKVRSASELDAALAEAFRYDRKLVIERGIDAREIETAVLGLSHPEVSLPGEIVPRHEFYSYEAKYLDPNGAELMVPAPISEAQTREVQQLSLRAFEALELEGLARVDFFLDRHDGRWYVNEVNTLPGFTEVSMYARMWQHTGLSYRDLVTQLIELALARFDARQKLETRR